MIHGTCTSWLAFALKWTWWIQNSNCGHPTWTKPLQNQPYSLELFCQHHHPFEFMKMHYMGNPTPHMGMPMMCNNLLEVNLTNKGRTYFDLKSIPFNFGFFSSFDQLHYFHYRFVVLGDCSKCEHSWFAFAKNKCLVEKKKIYWKARRDRGFCYETKRFCKKVKI